MIVIIITIIQSFKQTCGEKKRTNKTIWILSTFLQAEERGANNQKQKMWGNPRKCAPGSHPNKPNVTQTGRMALLQRRLKGMSRCHSLGLLTSLFLLFLLLGRRFKEVVRVGGEVALEDYDVLIRLSSCLMAGSKERENTRTKLGWQDPVNNPHSITP